MSQYGSELCSEVKSCILNAETAEQVGELSKAKQALRRAVDLVSHAKSDDTDPGAAFSAFDGLASFHERHKNFTDAEAVLRKGLRFARKGPARRIRGNIRISLGLLFAKQEKFDDAVRQIFAALDLYAANDTESEDVVLCYSMLGLYHGQMNKNRHAEEYFRRAAHIAWRRGYPDEPLWWDKLADVLRRRGKAAEADLALACHAAALEGKEDRPDLDTAISGGTPAQDAGSWPGWAGLWASLVAGVRIGMIKTKLCDLKATDDPSSLYESLDLLLQRSTNPKVVEDLPRALVRTGEYVLSRGNAFAAILVLEYALDRTVLPNDESEITRKLFAHALEQLGCAYVAAGNSEPGMAKLAEALALNRSVYGACSMHSANLAALFASVCEFVGKTDDALVLYGEAASCWEQIGGTSHYKFAENLASIRRLSETDDSITDNGQTTGSADVNETPATDNKPLPAPDTEEAGEESTENQIEPSGDARASHKLAIGAFAAAGALIGYVGIPVLLYLTFGWSIWALSGTAFFTGPIAVFITASVAIYLTAPTSNRQTAFSEIGKALIVVVSVAAGGISTVYGCLTWQPDCTSALRWLSSHGGNELGGFMIAAVVGSQLGRLAVVALEKLIQLRGGQPPLLRYNEDVLRLYVWRRRYDAIGQSDAPQFERLSMYVCNGTAVAAAVVVGRPLSDIYASLSSTVLELAGGYVVAALLAVVVSVLGILSIGTLLRVCRVPVPRMLTFFEDEQSVLQIQDD